MRESEGKSRNRERARGSVEVRSRIRKIRRGMKADKNWGVEDFGHCERKSF